MTDAAFRASLKAALALEGEGDRPIVVLGVGSELRGDDAAGLLVVDALERDPLERVHALAGGTSPENRTSEIRRLSPSQLIIVDSADMGLPPGSLRIIDPGEIDKVSPGTHSLPLSLLAGYVSRETGCAVTVIGIQPRSLQLEAGISDEVRAAVQETVDALRERLAPGGEPPLRQRDGAPGH